ncbi:hypothetical protein BDK92_0707 [Micromonospora pisi]|uniref:Nicotinamide mononucleotide transporter n=1 Tax=Micromonospora pisi TaxID=589240 RepID=A0A495JC31_9ACTN|nr:hypothetical protein BDK92_0707 [Micromonospora pisi]
MRKSVIGTVFIAFSGCAAASMAMAATHRETGLGLGPAWAWILTGFQVSALLAVGRGLGVGWLIGASVQVCWVTYAMLTAQHGFIPGCVVSLVVQGYSYLRTLRQASVNAGIVSSQEPARRRDATARIRQRRRTSFNRPAQPSRHLRLR